MEAGDKVFDHIWLPPDGQFLARNFANVGSLGQKNLPGMVRQSLIAELPGVRGDGQLSAPEARHIHCASKSQRGFVVAVPIRIEARYKPIPSRMVRIEAASLRRETSAPFPIAGIGGEEPEVRERESIHRIQSQSPRCRDPESLQIFAKELDRRQRMKSEMIRWRNFYRVLRGCE